MVWSCCLFRACAGTSANGRSQVPGFGAICFWACTCRSGVFEGLDHTQHAKRCNNPFAREQAEGRPKGVSGAQRMGIRLIPNLCLNNMQT
jgi:hypothetical protein